MSGWLKQRERGQVWTIRLMVFACRRLGRATSRLLMRPVVWYFLLTSRTARKASAAFHQRVNGRARLGDFYRQLITFSEALLDRVFLLMGDTAPYRVESTGREQLHRQVESGSGAILLGAHLGSFEVCRVLAQDRASIQIYVVAYHDQSRMIRQVLDALNPALSDRVIDASDPCAVFRMREVVARGGLLAILADRTGIGEKSVVVDFMGAPTHFPVGPFIIASVLKCPVFCFFGVRTGHLTYRTFVERLAERVALPRRERQAALTRYAQDFANRLGGFVQKYPDNWFNFYDFWKHPVSGKTP